MGAGMDGDAGAAGTQFIIPMARKRRPRGDGRPRAGAAIALFLAALFVMPAFAVPSADGAGAARSVLTVTKEWTSPDLSPWDALVLNDTDGDGARELIVWSPMGNSLRLFDPPRYALRLEANYSWVRSVTAVDLGANGSVQLLVSACLEGRTDPALTVIDGKDLSTRWTSPEIPGLVDHRVGDVDGDGRPEIVVLGSTVSVYDGTTFQMDWASPALPDQGSALELADLDSDAALEIVAATLDIASNLSEILAFDGTARSLMWKSEPIANASMVMLLHAGDVDADAGPELVVESSELNDAVPIRTGFTVLAGPTGAREWNFSVPAMAVPELTDPDGDGMPELFVQASDMGSIMESYNVTFFLFDMEEHRLAWSLGPVLNTFGPTEMKQSAYRLVDMNGDGSDEIVIMNITLSLMTGSQEAELDVFGGRDLSMLWSSPVFRLAMSDSSLTGIDPLRAVELDSDGSPEFVISETWAQPPSGRLHGIVRAYSAATFTEEWNSGDLQSYAFGFGGQLVKDSAPDLFVVRGDGESTWGCLLDTATHNVAWESQKFKFSNLVDVSFTDLFGGPWNEVLFIGGTDDGAGNFNSTVYLLNDTTLDLGWQSERMEGQAQFLAVGDIDGDSRSEAALRVSRRSGGGADLLNVVIYDFREGPPPQPDLALAAGDLAISNSTPFAGMALDLAVRLRNIGDAGAPGCALALSVDGARVDSRTVDVAPSGSTLVTFVWTAVSGTHVLSVAADPENLLPERVEGNNDASIEVIVGARPLPIAVISAPREGASFAEGEKINFSAAGSGSPAGGGLSYRWSSELAGAIGSLERFSAALPAGFHAITLTVDDGFGRARATVNITVAAAPPPAGTTSAVIGSPRNGASFNAGERILFDGTGSVAARAGYNLSFSWSSNQSGPLGTSSRFWKALPAGTHNITLAVDDGHGGSSSAHALIKVRPSEGVVAFISSPQEGDGYDFGENITFDGTGSSGPAGAVLLFTWEDNATGLMGTEARFSRALPPGEHSVTLSVSDGKGHSASAAVNFTVRPNRAPRVAVLNPLEGAVLKGTVEISGTAQDDISVDTIFIRFDDGQPVSISGSGSWSYSWDTRKAANGNHRVAVWASDGSLQSPEVLLNVTVRNAAPSGEGDAPGVSALLAAGLVAIIVGVAAAILLMKRRKGPEVLEVEAES